MSARWTSPRRRYSLRMIPASIGAERVERGEPSDTVRKRDLEHLEPVPLADLDDEPLAELAVMDAVSDPEAHAGPAALLANHRSSHTSPSDGMWGFMAAIPS